MIDITSLSKDDVNIRVIYRQDNEGSPEYAHIVGWSSKRITIRVYGDKGYTAVLPHELTRDGG